MSRVIKFRAWDRRNKKIYPVVSVRWSYGSVLRHFHRGVPEGYWLPEEVVVILGNGKMRTFSYLPRPRSYIRVGSHRVLSGRAGRHIRDLTLLEFTGLMDQNKIEVYDGDIARNRLRTGQVFYEDETACWYVGDPGGHSDAIFLEEIEVIGNVYEHPGLLETSA